MKNRKKGIKSREAKGNGYRRRGGARNGQGKWPGEKVKEKKGRIKQIKEWRGAEAKRGMEPERG